ncbi:TetR/AcrR family transcriptional regulator [Mycobacterium sp. ITM-2016-00318]|uniref:TetR/AcrR family transcriptional regulator n=1 Tax=Mycobacterium sp. ITM-2016-00318 TaxID=2099693 RepID=UPI000CF9FBDB|nr:TetR/AcrR family transcriptional regulator [Mycobacterium sp. ITM-2016-00318]WNG93346.1 TetR/AcrR family transcriptional regulator [Mycobacterium sp. ITM-2016-00318]
MAPTPHPGIRRRPKDRKAQIARASAEAFSALGYHAVSMEAIAARVGISATALYRHYPSKYDLFRDAVLALGEQLVACTAFSDETRADADTLQRLIGAITDTALANRESGGLYRWEARFLRGDDQATLNAQMRIVNHRIQRPLMALRPGLTSRQRWTLSSSMLSVIGSIVDHHAKLPAVHIRAVLAEVATAISTADVADVPETTAAPGRRRRVGVDPSKYEALLTESVALFNRKGYRDTTMEEIASAVGMPTSGIYRYFSGKNDILAAIYRRAADRLSSEASSILVEVSDPERALTGLIDAYVKRSFDHPELAYVYYTERLHMAPADQKILRNLQRATVESWVRLVTAIRSDWTVGQARFAVHAAMALVIDVGNLVAYDNTVASRMMVGRLLDLTLLGRYRLRTTLPAR